jgi:hypothetical protein
MKQLLSAGYRLLKVVYFGAALLSLVVAIRLIYEEYRPHEVKLSETLTCADGRTFTQYSFFQGGPLDDGKKLCGTLYKVALESGEEKIVLNHEGENTEVQSTEHTFTKNYETQGSWDQVVEYSVYAIVIIAAVFAVIRWVFNYVVFGNRKGIATE